MAPPRIDDTHGAGLQSWLQSEVDKWGPIIRKAGVYAD